VDGMHIRNLMITYFFRFFEQLVHSFLDALTLSPYVAARWTGLDHAEEPLNSAP
jgi:DNA gyrase/topoisomerase IV subunit B